MGEKPGNWGQRSLLDKKFLCGGAAVGSRSGTRDSHVQLHPGSGAPTDISRHPLLSFPTALEARGFGGVSFGDTGSGPVGTGDLHGESGTFQ